MRKALLTLAAIVAVLAPATPARAHTRLVSSDPARDAALAGAPAAVTLTFSQRLRPDFATIVVSDAARQRVPAAAPVLGTAAATASVTFSRPLTDGRHTVAYRVVSVDGHTVEGSYTFTVGGPAGSAVAAQAGDGGLPRPVLVGLGGLGLLCVLVAAYLYAARRRATPAADR